MFTDCTYSTVNSKQNVKTAKILKDMKEQTTCKMYPECWKIGETNKWQGKCKLL